MVLRVNTFRKHIHRKIENSLGVWIDFKKGGVELVEVNNRIGQNIRYLRCAYRESQLDLSLTLGLDSPNTIANYEKGARTPKPKIQKKIAMHYRITEDELSHDDFSGLHFSFSVLENKDKMVEMTMLMFPMVTSEEARKNAFFNKGYEAHVGIINAMKTECGADDLNYDICIDAYYDSYDKFKTPESIANILGLFIMTEIGLKNKWMIDGAEALNEKRIKSDEFLKKFYLKDFDYHLSENDSLPKNMTKQDMIKFEEAINELLKKLKFHAKLANLADYYMALRYMFCCVSNELTNEMNKAIGSEMLWAFAKLGNSYAKRFIRKGIENSRK